MILTRTPLRVSLFGGGTDLPGFCSTHTGRVLTSAIDKYIYAALKPRFDGKTRACYSQNELVDDPAELQHDIIRSVLVKAKVKGVDVVTFSDVPHNGTGLGTSSALAVGLVHAVYALRGVEAPQYEMAAEAAKIEIVSCRKPIGRQDQYACALGGMRELIFEPGNDRVGTYQYRGMVLDRLHDCMLLFHTGNGRDGDAILRQQAANIPQRIDTLISMAELANDAGEVLRRGRILELGMLLDKAWDMKKTLAAGITNLQIDRWYDEAKAAGAWGGKVCGAGGGGFMMFLADPLKHTAIIAALPDLQHVPFNWDHEGTKVVYP